MAQCLSSPLDAKLHEGRHLFLLLVFISSGSFYIECLEYNRSSWYIIKELKLLIDRKVTMSSVMRLPIKRDGVQRGEGDHFSLG